MLDQAFEALKSYDWGQDPKILVPIDEAVVKTREDAAARKDLESRLAGVLSTPAPRDAKDYACRQLRTVGTAASVPALEGLLSNPELAHMARYALERIPDAQAGQALQRHLPKLTGKLKVGVIASLGARAQADVVVPRAGFSLVGARPADGSHRTSVSLLRPLVNDADEAVAQAAARSLGQIGTPEAAEALNASRSRPETAAALADASMACAEKLASAGKKSQARKIYERLLKASPSKPVKLAVEKGLAACREG